MTQSIDIPSFSQFVKWMESGESITAPDGSCPVGTALGIFRGRWKADVIYRICAGVSGFGELQRQIPGVTRAMLSSALKELECDGIIHRREFMDGNVKRTEYTLTEAGNDHYPVFYALMVWGWKHAHSKGKDA